MTPDRDAERRLSRGSPPASRFDGTLRSTLEGRYPGVSDSPLDVDMDPEARLEAELRRAREPPPHQVLEVLEEGAIWRRIGDRGKV